MDSFDQQRGDRIGGKSVTGWKQNMKRIWIGVVLLVIGWSLVSCSSRPDGAETEGTPEITMGSLTEVAPPSVIQELRQSLERYQPQVSILTPQSESVIQDTSVSVQLQVQDLPLYQDPELQMGPHLHLILDNQPYQAVYSVKEPVVLQDLEPGTHTLRVFASRPWHESFKNEGAYAQTTFHVYTPSDDNRPDPAQPLLTYSRPKGNYGAEPVMLDFYLTNAPLHLVAQENPEDEIADWRIRVTVNGESFFLDRWQPVYLKGLQPGTNWVQLEFLDEQGNPVKNAFNNTVRLITYQSGGQDTLAKLVRNEISAQEARTIVNPNNKTEGVLSPPAIAPPEIMPEATPEASIEPEVPLTQEIPESEPEVLFPQKTPKTEPETIEEILESEPTEKFPGSAPPAPQELPETDLEIGEETASPEDTEKPVSEPDIPSQIKIEPEPSLEATPSAEPKSEPEPATQPLPGIFDRLRRPQISPNPSPEPLLPEVVVPEPEAEPELDLLPEASSLSTESDQAEAVPETSREENQAASEATNLDS